MSLSKRDTFVKWVDAKKTMWKDANGHIHFSVANGLKAYDLEDTQENRKRIIQIFRQVWGETHPNAPILSRKKPDSEEFYDQGVE